MPFIEPLCFNIGKNDRDPYNKMGENNNPVQHSPHNSQQIIMCPQLQILHIDCVMDNNNNPKPNSDPPKQEKPQLKPSKEQQDINNLINEFEQGQLNLTNEEKKEGEEEAEDAEVMRKIKEEYEKFMKDMQGEGQEQGPMGVGDLGKAFEELLSGLGGDDDKTGEAIGQKFQSMFKNLESPQNFQKAASQLLNQFMDKSLLEQPLKQTKQNYEEYMKKIKDKGEEVPKHHEEQYEIVCKLVESLEKQPNQKQKMIDLFSKLQQKGTPPEGIAPSFGFF